MGFCVRGSAAVRKKSHSVADISCVPHRVFDRELRGKAHNVHSRDATAVKLGLEIGAPEGAVAVGRDHNLAGDRLEASESRRSP